MARSGHFSRARGSPSKKSLHASEQDRPDIARRRERWKKYQGRLDAKRLVFIDETPACAGAGLYGVGSVKRDFSIRGELAVVHANARYTLVFGRSDKPDNDEVIRIGGAAPGRQAHSLGRRCSHA